MANQRNGPGTRTDDLEWPFRAIAQAYRDLTDEVLAMLQPARHDVSMNLIIRTASVRWKGGSKGGTQVLSTGSGVLKQARCASGIPLKQDAATDPAELIAAAHAGSFSSALSDELAGLVSGNIVTTATVTLQHLAAGWTTMNIHLNVIARLPKLTQNEFIDATVRAKTRCFVSQLLRANISMNAKLEP